MPLEKLDAAAAQAKKLAMEKEQAPAAKAMNKSFAEASEAMAPGGSIEAAKSVAKVAAKAAPDEKTAVKAAVESAKKVAPDEETAAKAAGKAAAKVAPDEKSAAKAAGEAAKLAAPDEKTAAKSAG